jgi:hypothetical protein
MCFAERGHHHAEGGVGGFKRSLRHTLRVQLFISRIVVLTHNRHLCEPEAGSKDNGSRRCTRRNDMFEAEAPTSR